MILSAILGLYGLIMCYLLVVGHLMRLKSFGQDYLIPIMAQPGQDLKDTIVRLPTPLLKNGRPEKRRKIKSSKGDHHEKPEDKLSFMQTLLMVSGTMTAAPAAAADSPSGWIIILVQSLVFIGIVLLFMPFLQKNSGETIYELNQSIMGRAIGSLLNLFISCYFVVTVCFQARFLGEVINYFY